MLAVLPSHQPIGFLVVVHQFGVKFVFSPQLDDVPMVRSFMLIIVIFMLIIVLI